MKIFEAKSINSSNHGHMNIGDKIVKCALGKNGVIAAKDKREGDGKSPIGTWPIRYVYWRKDKIDKPNSIFETIAIEEDFGWCDDSKDENYNKFVRHPYPSSAEKLWRDDGLYDIIVVLGHNDDPVKENMGSAIFLHCEKENYKPTEGCVAIKENDLRNLLAIAEIGSAIKISD